MSSAGADCVMTLVEMRSAPASAYARTVSSVIPPDTSTRNPAGAVLRTSETQARTSSGVMLSRSTIVGAGGDRLLHLLDAVALDLDGAAGPAAPAPGATASVMVEPGEVVVLHQHELGQRAAVVHAAAGAHRGLLDRPQPGQRLAGVPDPGRRAGGLDEATGERGDAREMAAGSSARCARR